MRQQNISLWVGLIFATLFYALPGESWALVGQEQAGIPTPPSLTASAYILMDAHTGTILAEKNGDKHLPPASLTKMMTMYVVSKALHHNQLQLEDPVHISQKAWRMGGSKMFVKVGDEVAVQDLVQGIIVQSGNDACVAMAEHLAGDEEAFASVMNEQANQLGMHDSHFTDSTGLPHPNHYTSPHDMAVLARGLINDFPEFYHWYAEKEFTYNHIKQYNRNQLLWHYANADGIKTGHTDEAGYCLAASAQQNDTRLIAIVFGTPSEASRTADTIRLFNYGFHFYQTLNLFNDVLDQPQVWMGKLSQVKVGLSQPLYLTLPRGQSKDLEAVIHYDNVLKAPLQKGQQVGTLTVTLNQKVITEQPVIALENIDRAGFFSRIKDYFSLMVHRIMIKYFGDKDDQTVKVSMTTNEPQSSNQIPSLTNLNAGLLPK